MIRDLELRLAEVLGERLPAPFTGRVDAAPASGPVGGQPRIVLGVVGAQRVEPEWHGVRAEVVPGAPAPRRVVRLRCDLSLRVEAADGEGRAQQLAGVDALLYTLADPALRPALDPLAGTDPGFQLQNFEVDAGTVPLDPTTEAPVTVTAQATGLFWPAGAPGIDGEPIAEIHVRAGRVPIAVRLPATAFVAGGPAGEIELRVAAGAFVTAAAGTAPRQLGSLAVRLVAAGGKPGAGTLAGGTPGTAAGVRLLNVVGGVATVAYTPPATASRDVLEVSLDDSEGGTGVGLGRIPITVRGA